MLTNQDVINIFYGAADVLGVPGGWTLISKAGWGWLAQDRQAPFDPSHLDQKPAGLSEMEWAHLHMRISEALGPIETQPSAAEAPAEVVEEVWDSGHGTGYPQPGIEEVMSTGGAVGMTTAVVEAGIPAGRRKSLFGPAFATPYNNDDAKKAYAAQPVVTKVVGEWPEVLRLAKEIPDAIHIYRHWDRWRTIFPFPSTDPMPRLVQRWMREVEPERRLNEFLQAGGRTLHFEAFNEPGIDDPEQVKAYTEFEVLRIEVLAEVGCLACIGQFSVGSPNTDNMTSFLPAIEALNKTVVDGQIGSLGVHEYGTVWPWAWMGRNQGANLNADPFPDVTDRSRTTPAYLLGRFQHYYQDVFEPAGYGDTPMIMTETGLDTIADERILQYIGRDEYPQGYRTCFKLWTRLFDFESNIREFAPGVLKEDGTKIGDHEAFYVELLKWQDDFMCQFPFIKGALPFMTGGGDEWESFWIQYDAMTKFMDYVKTKNEMAQA